MNIQNVLTSTAGAKFAGEVGGISQVFITVSSIGWLKNHAKLDGH